MVPDRAVLVGFLGRTGFFFRDCADLFHSCMQLRVTAFALLIAMVFLPTAFAGGKKEGSASVTFHMETAETDNPKMIFPQLANGKQRFFFRSPEFSAKDIASFLPFPSAVGDDYGLVLTLKPGLSTRLAAITNSNIGNYMISQLNGRVVDGVMIDKQVDDGLLVIWKGVTLADINILDKELPRTGAAGKKK